MMETGNVQLDDIVSWIDRAFGEAAPAPGRPPDCVNACVPDEGDFQHYLQDQVNRRIIRDYLVNALVLGAINEGALASFASRMATEERRAILALYMLMSSVEDAMDIPSLYRPSEVLQPLRARASEPGTGRPPIELVPR